MLSSAPEMKSFSPGERVPQTGIYECKHSDLHTATRQLIFEGGKKFPLCKTCFWSMRYLLVGDCTPEDMEPLRRQRNDATIRALSV